jgi:hypothetical protein
MKPNIGPLDRALRLIIGLVILGLGYVNGSWWGLVGLLPILTAVVRFCPAYCPFKINTGKRE